MTGECYKRENSNWQGVKSIDVETHQAAGCTRVYVQHYEW